jgi:hypothetical protein
MILTNRLSGFLRASFTGPGRFRCGLFLIINRFTIAFPFESTPNISKSQLGIFAIASSRLAAGVPAFPERIKGGWHPAILSRLSSAAVRKNKRQIALTPLDQLKLPTRHSARDVPLTERTSD